MWDRFSFDILPPLVDRSRLSGSEPQSQLGALTVVRDDHAECLHSVPFEPLLSG